MKKPLLIVVTGMPASGKTTLARLLSNEINCPLLSRDALKEGYVNTMKIAHSRMDDSAAIHIYEAFFEAIELFISKKISVIAEAAFQDKLWKPKLKGLLSKAEIKIIICKTNIHLAKSRFEQRLSTDISREKFHGDSALLKNETESLFENYVPVKMDVPILEVDTSENYIPGLEDIIQFIQQ
jgi:predicted kinase